MSIFNKYSHQINTIIDFRKAFVRYYEIDYNRSPSPDEEQEKIILRKKLNTLNGEVDRYVCKAGVSASVYYSPPPAVGGLAGDIHFFSNLFNLHGFSISPQMVIDVLDRSAGNYLYLQKISRKKMLNPLFWIGEIIRSPFHLLDFAGFDGDKIEISWFGKAYKLLSALLVLIATILTILNLSGMDTKKMWEIRTKGNPTQADKISATPKNSE